MADLRQSPWTQFNVTNHETYGIYLLDDSANQLRLFSLDGTEIISRRIQLASRSWRGAFGYVSDRYITLLDTSTYRLFDIQNKVEVSDKVLRLPSGEWTAAAGHEYFLDNRSNQLRSFLVLSDQNNEPILEEFPDDNVPLLSRSWKGVSLAGYLGYFVESSGSIDRLHEYDLYHNRIAFPDYSPYNLPSGVWGLCIAHSGQGAIHSNKFHILEVNTRKMRVFRFHLNLDADFSFIEIPDESFTLPTGTFRDGFFYRI